MREAVDALLVLGAIVVAIGFVAPDVPWRRIAAFAAVVVVAFLVAEGVAARRRSATSAPAVTAVATPAVSGACDAPLQRDATAATGFVDTVTVGGRRQGVHDAAAVRRGAELVFSGWISGFAADAPADGVCLAVDGRIASTAATVYGLSRPDVAAALKSSRLAATGYSVRYGTAQLDAGVHRFEIVAVGAARYRALPVLTLRVRD